MATPTEGGDRLGDGIGLLGGEAALLDGEGRRVTGGEDALTAGEPAVSVGVKEPVSVAGDAAQSWPGKPRDGDDTVNGHTAFPRPDLQPSGTTGYGVAARVQRHAAFGEQPTNRVAG